MKYGAIKFCDIANGPGVRTSLFVSGCRNHCEGCFQPETWSFDYGEDFGKDVENQILESLRPSYITGLTILGGDPFEKENQEVLVPFLRRVREKCPTKTIWAYTGYVLEQDLVPGGSRYYGMTEEFLSMLDVLVDGPFILERKDISLKFRGSSNQRIIQMRQESDR